MQTVVGEDLGAVEDWVREELGRWRVLSTRLLWFEEGPPSDYPRDSLAAATRRAGRRREH